MSTFLGSSVSSLLLDDTQIVLTSNSVPAISLETSKQEINFNNYALVDFAALKADLDLGAHKIRNVSDPVLAQDVATKAFIDAGFYANTVPLNSITAPSGSVSLNSKKITDLATPTLDTDAATKAYVDAQVANDSEIVSASKNTKVVVSDIGNLTAFTNNSINTMNIDTVSVRPLLPIDMGSTQKIINLANATAATDAMNRQSGDARYYLNTVVLNSITAPTG